MPWTHKFQFPIAENPDLSKAFSFRSDVGQNSSTDIKSPSFCLPGSFSFRSLIKSEIGVRYFQYIGPVIWNSLPLSVRHSLVGCLLSFVVVVVVFYLLLLLLLYMHMLDVLYCVSTKCNLHCAVGMKSSNKLVTAKRSTEEPQRVTRTRKPSLQEDEGRREGRKDGRKEGWKEGRKEGWKYQLDSLTTRHLHLKNSSLTSGTWICHQPACRWADLVSTDHFNRQWNISPTSCCHAPGWWRSRWTCR